MQIGAANLISGISNNQNINKIGAGKTVNFSDFMNEALDKVNNLQKESSDATDSFIKGETDNIHTVMIAGAKADLALQMTLQVRNKVMDAYNEIMNMQI